MTGSAYRDDYSNCQKTWVQFQVTSPNLTGDEITNLLAAEPTSTEKDGTGVVWLIESTDLKSRDIRRHLDWLADGLRSAAPGLRELRQRDDVYIAVLCWWEGDGFPHGPTLSPVQMQWLAELDLEITIGITERRKWWQKPWNLIIIFSALSALTRISRH